MIWAFWCILIAGLLPYVATVAAKWGAKNYDNHNPRVWLANQTGFRARGNSAQANSFEAFPFFASGVLIAAYVNAPENLINLLATIFVVSRAFYIICYFLDKDKLRSSFWSIGLLSVVGLFIVAGRT